MANLDKPKIITPTGCPNGSAVVGTGADVLVHTCIAGTDEWDAVTIDVSASASVVATVKVPSTAGGQASFALQTTTNVAPVRILSGDCFNGGAQIYVNGAATVSFKIGVLRYPAGKNE
jgi:hypothetical protein